MAKHLFLDTIVFNNDLKERFNSENGSIEPIFDDNWEQKAKLNGKKQNNSQGAVRDKNDILKEEKSNANQRRFASKSQIRISNVPIDSEMIMQSNFELCPFYFPV